MPEPNIYYLNYKKDKRNTAGSKAPDDIAQICRDAGFRGIAMPVLPKGKKRWYQVLWLTTVCVAAWRRLKRTVSENSVIIYQHPFYGIRVAEKMIPRIQKAKKCRFVAVIHDLESLRGGIAGVVPENKKTHSIGDHQLLLHFDAIICHNEHMKRYLIEQGFDEKKLIPLGIFDYLTDFEPTQRKRGEAPSIAIAGNLASGKCKYIYSILANGSNPSLSVNLYGNNYDEGKADGSYVYFGSFKPEELPARLQGDFGLVWDGPSVDTCAGNTGEYLRYNNPHKTSLYLVSGMPVIVWSEAAIADFVLKNHVGITVDSLLDIETSIKAVTDEEYKKMCNNAEMISRKLRNGSYFMKALSAAEKAIGTEHYK